MIQKELGDITGKLLLDLVCWKLESFRIQMLPLSSTLPPKLQPKHSEGIWIKSELTQVERHGYDMGQNWIPQQLDGQYLK
jgi:hypothetical protein